MLVCVCVCGGGGTSVCVCVCVCVCVHACIYVLKIVSTDMILLFIIIITYTLKGQRVVSERIHILFHFSFM